MPLLLRAAARDSRRLQDVPSLCQRAGRFWQRTDESSMVCAFRVVHSLDELSVPRCNLVHVRTGVLKLGFWVISHSERLADTVRVRGTCSGLALMQMDLDPHLHRGRQPVDRGPPC